MYPHRIRLRGPCECEPTGLEPRRVTMPCRLADVGLAGFRGMVRFVGKFGYPGKADPEFEHIWLTCDGCTDGVLVKLNEKSLGQNSSSSEIVGQASSLPCFPPVGRLEACPTYFAF